MDKRNNLMSEIRGAVARGWCAEGQTHKEMDAYLAEAISREIFVLLTSVSALRDNLLNAWREEKID